eukprot:UN23044
MAVYAHAAQEPDLTYAHTPFDCLDCHRYKEGDVETFNGIANNITGLLYNNILMEDLTFRCEFEEFKGLPWTHPTPHYESFVDFSRQDRQLLQQQYNLVSHNNTILDLFDPHKFNCVLHHRAFR